MNAAPEFWRAWSELPGEAQEEGRETFARLRRDASDPLLFRRRVDDNVWSIRLADGYRALAVIDGERWIWFRLVCFIEGKTIIESYSNWPQAEMMKSMLDSFGVDAELVDDNTVRTDWLYSNLLGGVKLRVPDSQAELARALLAAPADVADPDPVVACPACGSERTGLFFDKRGSHLSILAGIPVVPPVRKRRCEDCGETWEIG